MTTQHATTIDFQSWIKDVREAEVRAHCERMANLDDEAFMSDVFESLQEVARGVKGKTTEEIRRERGR